MSDNNKKNYSESLLEDILSASADQEDIDETKKQEEDKEIFEEKDDNISNKEVGKDKKPAKKPMTFFWFLKIAWALLIVLLIITAGFLTYMILNPEQAQFFKTFEYYLVI